MHKDDTRVIIMGALANTLAKELGRPIRTLKDLKECHDKGIIQECPEVFLELSKAMKEEDDAEDNDDL